MVLENRGPCDIDLNERYEIILHFRALADIGPMLVMNLKTALSSFRKKLLDYGWGAEEIAKIETIAYSRSVYEVRIPRTIRSRGNYFDYLSQRGRSK